MDFIGFMNMLKKRRMTLFTLQDVEALFPEASVKTVKNNLANWAVKGYLKRLKRNVYECVQLADSLPDFYVANQLYRPSYVSLETALSFYGMIPEEAAEVTSISTKPTRTFRNKYGVFTYRTCKKNAFLGYRVMKMNGLKVLVADREKALVDFVYYRLLDGVVDFTQERLSLSKLRKGVADGYAKRFNKRTLEAVKKLI